MYLGIEFFADSLIGISANTFIKTKLLVDGLEKDDFFGYDFFDLNTVILKEKRISASGRSCHNNLSSLAGGLGTLEVKPTQPALLETNKHPKIQIELETNLFKDLEMPKQKMRIKLISNKYVSPVVPLNSTWIKVEFIQDKILIDITDLFKHFSQKIS